MAKVLTQLGQMFRDSWTGGASGEPGRYHSREDWERFKFKDLFDNNRWVREQMVDENGNPMFSARTGEPIMTNYYRPRQTPAGGGQRDGRGGRPGDDRGISTYRIPPHARRPKKVYQPVDTSLPEEAMEEAMYGAGDYYPEAEYGAGYYSRLGYSGEDVNVGDGSYSPIQIPRQSGGDAAVAEGNYTPIQGPPNRTSAPQDSEQPSRIGVVPDANANSQTGGEGWTDQDGNYYAPYQPMEGVHEFNLAAQRQFGDGQKKMAPTRSHLKSEEGYKRMPYIDPISGEWHVGHGHKITEAEANQIRANGGWDKRRAGQQLDRDIVQARQGADRLFRSNGVVPENMPAGFREAISNMVFQMGTTGVARFENMWAAIRDGRWGDVLTEMKDSAWAQSQTPDRADEVIAMARNSLAVGGS